MLGGGVTESALCARLRARASGLLADPATAMLGHVLRACADGLMEIPRTLAANTGLDPVTTCESLLLAHAAGKHSEGIDCVAAHVCDLADSGIVEPLAGKHAQITLAAEAAMAIVRIDAVHYV